MLGTLVLVTYIVGGLALLFLALSGRTHLALMLLVPVFPLQNLVERFHSYPMGKDFIDIVLFSMLVGWAFKSSHSEGRMFEWSPINKLLVVMMAYTYFLLWQGVFFLSVPLPLNPTDVRLQCWKNYMIFPLIFFLTYNSIRNVRHMKWMLVCMMVSMMLVDYYTVRQILSMSGLLSREKITGTFVWTGVNAVAAFYAQYIFVFLGLFVMYKNKLFKLLSGTMVVVGTYIVLFLYSRGAYAAVLTGLLAFCYLRKKVLLIPIMLFVLSWQSILPESVITRINQTKTEEGQLDSSSAHRIELWEESLNLFKRNPLTGIGFNTVQFAGLHGGFEDTHNIYLKILSEQGTVGMIIFLLLFLAAFKIGYRLYREADDSFLKGLGIGFAACVIATMTTNLFGDRWMYLQLGAYYWAFMGLAMRGLAIAREGTVEDPEDAAALPGEPFAGVYTD